MWVTAATCIDPSLKYSHLHLLDPMFRLGRHDGMRQLRLELEQLLARVENAENAAASEVDKQLVWPNRTHVSGQGQVYLTDTNGSAHVARSSTATRPQPTPTFTCAGFEASNANVVISRA